MFVVHCTPVGLVGGKQRVFVDSKILCSTIMLVHVYHSFQDISVLQDLETIKQLGHILKTNVRACTAVGHPFVVQVHVHVCM